MGDVECLAPWTVVPQREEFVVIEATDFYPMRRPFYEKAPLPAFLVKFVLGEACRNRHAWKVNPKLVTPCGNFLIAPHPRRQQYNYCMEQLTHPSKQLSNPLGFCLLCWYVPPQLQQHSLFFRKPEGLWKKGFALLRDRRTVVSSATRSINASGMGPKQESCTDDLSSTSYLKTADHLHCIMDFTREHLAELESLERGVMEHLVDVYSVADPSEFVLYFNYPNGKEFSSLHLHVVHPRLLEAWGRDGVGPGGIVERDHRMHLLRDIISDLRQHGRVELRFPLIYGTGPSKTAADYFAGDEVVPGSIDGYESVGPIRGEEWVAAYNDVAGRAA